MSRRLCGVILMVTACSQVATPITPPSSSTTTARTVAVVPASARPPRGVDPRTSCGRRAVFGDPADSAYLLPYPVGEGHRLHQSYCFAQGGHADQIAYDFLMPIGGDVLAARSGRVIALYEAAPNGGTGDNNYVFIEHDDGTIGHYAHLTQNGVDVEVGDEVVAGQRIGSSGSSGLGLTDAPHLHFGVYSGWPPVDGDDLAVNFRNADGPLDLLGGLLQGSVYRALHSDVESRPVTPPGSYADADLKGVVLTGATLWAFDFTAANLSGAVLTGADLAFATLRRAKLIDADLTHATLTGADLVRADLAGARLSGSDLTRANLTGANLTGADLSNAYLVTVTLIGADLTDVNLTGAVLIGPRYDATTRWPSGYLPPPRP